MLVPVMVSIPDVRAQAEAMERESAQLKAKAECIRQAQLESSTTISTSDENSTVDFESSSDYDPLCWPSPNTTPIHSPRGRNSVPKLLEMPPSGFQVRNDNVPPPPWQSSPIACMPMQCFSVPCATAQPNACFSTPGLQLIPVACHPGWDSSAYQDTHQFVAQHMRTTLMMRNLPNDYTRDMVLELLDCKGLSGQYDFFYLPVDFQTKSGLGYAFVNFITHEDAEMAQLALHGFKTWKMTSHKVLDVNWSELSQGLAANIERHYNSSIFHSNVAEEFQPLLFSQGMRIPFPASTRPIRQPRLKLLVNGRNSEDDELALKLVGHNFVDSPIPLTPWERIKNTISVINTGDLAQILSNARNTLASKLNFVVPDVKTDAHSVGAVCTFHRQLHDAIPDLKLSLETLDKGDEGVTWLARCTGTQVKQFVPGLPIDTPASFALEVTVKDGGNGRPVWICWKFKVSGAALEAVSEPSLDDENISPMVLEHRRGECTPCAYFAFRSDGCRVGDDCEFCHLCTKSQAKAKKKLKANRLKAEGDAASLESSSLIGLELSHLVNGDGYRTASNEPYYFAPPGIEPYHFAPPGVFY